LANGSDLCMYEGWATPGLCNTIIIGSDLYLGDSNFESGSTYHLFRLRYCAIFLSPS
jgi:hypothetical protein